MNIEVGDIVSYASEAKRRLFGDMIIVHLLPNNRADVRLVDTRRHVGAEIWAEYLSDLILAKKHGNGGGI